MTGDTGCGQGREHPGQSPLRDLRVKDHRNPPHDNRTDYREDGYTRITVCSRSSLKAMSMCGSAAHRDRHPDPRRCVRPSPEFFLPNAESFSPTLPFGTVSLSPLVCKFPVNQFHVKLCKFVLQSVQSSNFDTIPKSLQNPVFQLNYTILQFRRVSCDA